MGRPQTAAVSRPGMPPRPPAAAQGQEITNLDSNRELRMQRPPAQIAFGKALQRSGSAKDSNRPPSARSQLTTSNLNSLNRRNGSFVGKKPCDPEVVVFTGEEAKAAAVGAAQEPGPDQTPIHKNYGKVPKYLERYKEEAADLEKHRAELRAKKAMPKGMKKMDEAERIETLE